ncbi:phage tail length tape measure family protein [Fulvimarina sp. 2208YS6-2-32]|uniref:Phage tail length tape measure family protein n=1 Tax=Fulvimarina uroteuthidis TaxID=3098149 RepID=A0ABU5HZN6_9HYPH|nr:phage tail length tape measure family protein [Fulvimarina sp. 2208YS6-2-32]MDY8108250.1 phage tail length tape measure family protein [Fulvimarina sp. 2208YS6-2-32]
MSNTTGPALGLSIDSSGMEKGLRDLEKVAPAAQRAEKAAEGFGKAAGEAGKAVGAGMSIAERELRKMNETALRIEKMMSAAMAGVGASGAAAAKGVSQAEKAMEDLRGTADQVSAALAKETKAMVEADRAAARMTEEQRKLREESDRLTKAQRDLDAAYQRQGSALQSIREKYAPALAISRRYREEVATITALEKDGLIVASEAAVLRVKAAEATDVQNAALRRMNETQKQAGLLARAGLRPDQGLNLFRQGGDIATMSMMGATPFAILSSQGAQIVEIFADTERGAKSALQEIGKEVLGLTRFITPLTVGLTAVAGASVYLAMKSTEAEKSMEASAKAADSYKKSLEGLGDAANTAADRVFDRNSQLSPVAIRAQLQTAISDQTKAIEAARSALTEAVATEAMGGKGFFGLTPSTLESLGAVGNLFDSDYTRTVEQVREIVRGFGEGTIEATSLIDQISKIKLDADTPEDVRALVDGLRDVGNRALEAEASITALREAANEMRQINFEEAIDGLAKMGGVARTQIQQLEEFRREAMRNATTEADETLVGDRYKLGLEELSRDARENLSEVQGAFNDLDLSPLQQELNATTRQYDLEIQEYIRTTNDAAGVAALRTEKEVALATIRKQASIDAAEEIAEAVEKEVEAARKAEEAWAKSSTSRVRSIEDQIASMKLEAETFGMSAGEAAAYRAEVELLAAAKRAAADAGYAVSPEEAAYIKDAAAAIGEYTAQMDAATKAKQAFDAESSFRDDLVFERDQAGRSQNEQQVYSRLRTADIDAQSAAGQQYAAYIRETQALSDARAESEKRFEEAQKKAQEEAKRTNDAMKSVGQTIVEAFGRGEGALDTFISAFAQLGNANAAKGFDKLFGGLFGDGSQSSSSSVIGALSKLPEMINRAPAFSPIASPFAPQFGSPVGQITRSPLPDITGDVSGLGSSLKSLNKQITGSAVAYRDAIAAIESRGSGDYAAIGPTNAKLGRALGRYQVMEANIPQWSKAALGRVVSSMEFLSSPKLQDAIFDNQFGGYVAKFGERGAAQAWFGGPGSVGKLGRKDVLGTSVGGYGERFISELKRMGGGSSKFSSSSTYGFAGDVSAGVIDAQRKIVSGAVPGAAPVSPGDPWSGIRVAGGDPWSGMRSASGGGLGGITASLPQNSVGGFLQSPVGQTALAGIGAFASGMQSGSPVGGAFSGALAGLATPLGPVGALIGGAAGLLGGIFGKSKAKKERQKQERQAAHDAWEQNYAQFAEIRDTVQRIEVGPLTKELRTIDQTLEQFRKLADKTGNGGNKSQVAAAIKDAEQYRSFLFDNFRKSLPKMTEDLAAGLGLNTEFTKARDAVLEQGKQLRGFLDDVSTAYADLFAEQKRIMDEFDQAEASAKGNFASAGSRVAQAEGAVVAARDRYNDYTVIKGREQQAQDALASGIMGVQGLFNTVFEKAGKGGGGGSAVDLAEAEARRDAQLAAIAEELAVAEKRLADARSAAIEGLLKTVSGLGKEQTDIEKALDQMQGAAAGLRTALVDLGLSAGEAEVRIGEAIAAGTERVRKEVSQGLTDEIASLDGKGYLADMRNLTKELEDRFSGASLINVDTSLVDAWFAKQAQAMVDGAGIAGEAFKELIALFPKLAGVVEEASGVFDQYRDRVFAATNDNSKLAGQLAEFDRSAAREREEVAKRGNDHVVELEKALAAERAQILAQSVQEQARRLSDYQERYFAATNDNNSLSGALKAFDRASGIERYQEANAGGQNMATLNAALAAEKVVLIQERLRAAYEEQTSEIESTISRLEGLSREWADLRRDLRLDDELSGLSPLQQAMEAQTRFRDVAARAAGGDEEAQEELAKASQDYLNEFRAYYASSEAYYSAFNEVQTTLEQAEATAVTELGVAKSQLDVARTQLDAMRTVDDSIGELTAALTAAMANLTAAQTAVGVPTTAAGGSTGGGGGGSPAAPGGGSPSPSVDRNIAYLQSNPDVLQAISSGDTFGLPAGSSVSAIAAAHYENFGQVEGRPYASGGLITGPGTGTSDDVNIRASNGEFMMRAAAVESYGLPTMNAINQGRLKLPTMARMPAPANDGGTAVNTKLLEQVRSLERAINRQTETLAGLGLEHLSLAREGKEAAKTAAKTNTRNSLDRKAKVG